MYCTCTFLYYWCLQLCIKTNIWKDNLFAHGFAQSFKDERILSENVDKQSPKKFKLLTVECLKINFWIGSTFFKTFILYATVSNFVQHS